MAQIMTDAGLLRVLSLLQTDITHMAVQNGAAPTTVSTSLNGEFARTDVIDPLVDGFTLVVEGFFDETQANGNITGFGAFGSGATDTAGTGTLLAATDANFTKTADEESLTISAEITVRRVST